jgi:hypothetical protein
MANMILSSGYVFEETLHENPYTIRVLTDTNHVGHRAWSIEHRVKTMQKNKDLVIAYLFSMPLAPCSMPKSVEIRDWLVYAIRTRAG